MATYNQSNFEVNEMSSENNSSRGSLNDLKSLDFNDMVNVVSYFSMSLGEETMDLTHNDLQMLLGGPPDQ